MKLSEQVETLWWVFPQNDERRSRLMTLAAQVRVMESELAELREPTRPTPASLVELTERVKLLERDNALLWHALEADQRGLYLTTGLSNAVMKRETMERGGVPKVCALHPDGCDRG